MAAEPITIYSHKVDPAGALEVLRKLAPKLELEGSPDAWTRATIREPAGFLRKPRTLSFNHRPDYYAGADFRRQMQGMQGYFARFPASPDKGRIMLLIQSFRFALTLWPMPEPELEIDSDDPRLRYVFAVAKHLDATLFLPSGLRDAAGRLLFGDEPADPEAIMPAIFREVTPELRSRRARSEGGTVPDPGDPPPPTAARVARRACALAAVAARALLEREDAKDPGIEATRRKILGWVEASGVGDELEPEEAEFLPRPLGESPRQDVLNFTWRIEGLAVLVWALGRFELPPHDEVVSPDELFRALAIPDARATRELIASASLRPQAELAAQRDRQFALHWRLVDWRVKPVAMDFGEFARTASFGPLDLSGARLLENDLAIGEVPISQASADRISAAESTALERHLAANWLDGGSEVYSETDVST